MKNISHPGNTERICSAGTASDPTRLSFAGCASANACSLAGEGTRMLCTLERSVSNGGWQLWELRQAGKLLKMTLPVTNILLISSSVIEQRLDHLLSLSTWRWASHCLSPTSVHPSFCTWSLKRAVHEEREGRKGEGNMVPPWMATSTSQLASGYSSLQPVPCSAVLMCSEAHNWQTTRAGSWVDLIVCIEERRLSSAASLFARRAAACGRCGQASLPHVLYVCLLTLCLHGASTAIHWHLCGKALWKIARKEKHRINQFIIFLVYSNNFFHRPSGKNVQEAATLQQGGEKAVGVGRTGQTVSPVALRRFFNACLPGEREWL